MVRCRDGLADQRREPPSRGLVPAAATPAAASGGWRFGLDLAAVDEDVDDASVVLEEVATRHDDVGRFDVTSRAP